MPKYNCCVPNCSVSHRNKKDETQFYRIPSDKNLRHEYQVFLKNDNLKIDSKNTRICSHHWEGGKKLCRTHLPSIFPWTVQVTPRREIKRHANEEIASSKRKRSRPKETFDESDSNSAGVDVFPMAKRKLYCDLDQLVEETESSQRSGDIESKLQKPQDENYAISEELKKLKEENAAVIAELQQLEKSKMSLNAELEKVNKENMTLSSALEEARKEIKTTKHQIENWRFDIEKFKESDKDVEFYTGFCNFSTLLVCYKLVEKSAQNMSYGNHERVHFDKGKLSQVGRPRTLSLFQEFVLVLMRLRLGLFERDLAHRFKVSESTVSVIVRTWLKLLRHEFEPLIRLPARDVIRLDRPKSFKELFPKVVIIVDCTEIEMERPSALDAQSTCYSSYKSKPTMKSLLGITPSGALAFVSELFPGSSSDKEITLQSGFVDILQPGDEVMADKGFNVQDELAAAGVTLVTPAFLKGKTQFSSEESCKNKTVASLRVHVERLMERIKNWHILDRKIPISMAPYASDIFIVIGALSNFLPPLIT